MGLLIILYAIGLSEFLKPKSTNLTKSTKINLIGFSSIWLAISIGSHFYYLNYFKDTLNTFNIPIPAGYIVTFVLAIPLTLLIAFTIIRLSENASFSYLAYVYFGVFYIGLGIISLGFLRHNAIVHNMSSNQLVIAFASVAGVWVSDTFAYLVGKKFGKRKLTPFISPNKSIEGLIGGIVFTAIFAILLLSVFSETAYWYHALIYGVLLSSVATLGDLVQSLWKRSVNIKDSGTLIPGHGGILDRIDAQLLASPFSLFFWILINNYLV
jgi:phosphatidate cytidylyltransferase